MKMNIKYVWRKLTNMCQFAKSGSKLLMVIVFLPVLLVSCIDEAMFNAGERETKTIELTGYSTIEIENTFEIELISDTVNKVVVSCGENLHPFIKIAVENDILYLKHEIKNNWSRKYEKVHLELHTKPFSIINIRKPVRIYTTKVYQAPSFAMVDYMKYSELDVELDVENCMVVMSSDNFGQFKVKGNAKSAQFWGWGSCLMDARDLVTQNCNILHRGIGKVYVNVTQQLDADIQAQGNIYYRGLPSVINFQRKKGAGDLIKLE